MSELFLKHFADAIDRNGEVKMEDEFRNYEEWDSLASLALVSMLDDEYEINISHNEFEKLKTVKDLYDHILAKSTK